MKFFMKLDGFYIVQNFCFILPRSSIFELVKMKQKFEKAQAYQRSL